MLSFNIIIHIAKIYHCMYPERQFETLDAWEKGQSPLLELL